MNEQKTNPRRVYFIVVSTVEAIQSTTMNRTAPTKRITWSNLYYDETQAQLCNKEQFYTRTKTVTINKPTLLNDKMWKRIPIPTLS